MAPHDSWAHVYDLVNQESFGTLYTRLCTDTNDLCQQLCQQSPAGGGICNILDIGAGTGRTAIPLARQGHRVTAVEPSVPMCEEIHRKAKENNVEPNLTIVPKPIQDYKAKENAYDLVLCLFTVIAYITTENDLTRTIQTLSRVLKPGGLFLLDIPQIEHFPPRQSYQTQRLQREVLLVQQPNEENLYHYVENAQITFGGKTVRYADSFLLRRWADEEIVKLCINNGLINQENQNQLRKKFGWTGAAYYLFRKTG